MRDLRLASLLALASVAVSARAGGIVFDDAHPTYALPASGAKTVSVYGTITLWPDERNVSLAGPSNLLFLPDLSSVLQAGISPQAQAYVEANVPGANYHGPLLNIELTSTTLAGDYTYEPDFGAPTLWFESNYFPPTRYHYAVNVIPAPEPGSLAALGLGALALLRRSKRT